MSTNDPAPKFSALTLVPEPVVTASLNSKLEALNKYEEIIWKVRAGYLAILYAGLTFLVGNADISKVENLKKLPSDNTASLTIFFLIVGFSLSAFMVDFSYLRKKMRVTVIRDLLMEYSYNPQCKVTHEKMYKLLQVAAERDLDEDFDDGREKYKRKVRWNLGWILLPIYAVTPVLAFCLGLMYRLLNCNDVWRCT